MSSFDIGELSWGQDWILQKAIEKTIRQEPQLSGINRWNLDRSKKNERWTKSFGFFKAMMIGLEKRCAEFGSWDGRYRVNSRFSKKMLKKSFSAEAASRQFKYLRTYSVGRIRFQDGEMIVDEIG